MQLHDYQDNASSALLGRTKSILNRDANLIDLYLKAITGAGKTVIMSDYMQKVVDDPTLDENIVFVWMSIGTGGLHKQSDDALQRELPADFKFFNTDNFDTVQKLEHKNVLVLNWETVNRMTIEGDTIVYDNVSMREGEKISLPKLFENTRNEGTKIIMIVDEAHIGAETPSKDDQFRTSIIKRDVIKPKVVVNVTATPKFSREIIDENIIEVSTEAVIDEGRIKRQVVVDDSMDINEDKVFVENVIHSAINKQEHLRELLKKEGNGHINPLCLIQIPNASLGAEMKQLAEGVLEERGYTYAKGNLAEVVDKNLNMENVKDSDSPVSFLINKQAISTGWDAPRAHIWVKLRDTKSAVFDAQTLGRILRMPEGKKVDDPKHQNYKFFEHDELNYAYVYTDNNYSISTTEYKNIFPTQKLLKDEIKEDVQSLIFLKQEVEKPIGMKVDKWLRTALEEMMDDKFETSIREFSDLKITVSTGSYAINELEDEETEVETKTFAITHYKDLMRYTNEFVRRLSTSHLRESRIFQELRRAVLSRQSESDDFEFFYQWVLSNTEMITRVLENVKRQIDDEIKDKTTKKEDDIDFVFPESILINEKIGKEIYEKSAYTKESKSAFGTEEAFAKGLDTNPNVKWWIKNVDSGKEGLSIVYTDEYNKLRTFYPDYVVRFNDGSIGIYETKSLPDLKPANTNAKADALTKYLEQLNEKFDITVHGGIVHMEKSYSTGEYVISDDSYQELTES